jgi:hypothetical protein
MKKRPITGTIIYLSLILIVFLVGRFGYEHSKKVGQERILLEQKTDSIIAVNIAVIEWKKKFGNKLIETEKPYLAELKDSVWYVSGSLKQGLDGGSAKAEILNKTCKILRVYHEQ